MRRLAVTIGLLFAHFFSLDASNPLPLSVSHQEGIEWVETCIKQYPEILWLANSQVRKTEEGWTSTEISYSERLFGKKYNEFDRTIMTLYCLRLLLDGSEKTYLQFTADQPENERLTAESFRTIHLWGKSLVDSRYQGLSELEMIQVMETALVLGDIGKSERARDFFRPFGPCAPDHDDFHGEVMDVLKDHPELSPSFTNLSPAGKNLLLAAKNLAHYGHITHLEGGPSMFTRLKQSGTAHKNFEALSFDLFVHTCDVTGALGHTNNRSSIVYTELTHKGMQAMAQACFLLKDPTKNEWDAYFNYLSVRASWLGLNPEKQIERVLTRLGASLRLFFPEEGLVLKKAIKKISKSDRQRIITQFDEQLPFRTPTYIPAVLLNLSNNPKLGSNKSERLTQAIILGLPLIAKVLEQHKQLLEQGLANPEVPLNFNQVAGVAKSNPESLSQARFSIDEEGNVTLQMNP